MEYRGPQPADYENVRALNLAFLKLLANPARAARLMRHLPAELRERSLQLTVLQRERLASVPFLLLSCREGDADFWESFFDENPNLELFDEPAEPDAAAAGVVSAALGYIWQLARQNAYAARLICGATVYWCEQLAERPLLDVVCAAAAGDILQLRSPRDAALWHKLLFTVTSSERVLHEAACLSALQRVLTHGAVQDFAPALAASSMRKPAMKVADEIER